MSDLQSTLLECEYFPCIAWYQSFMNHPDISIEKYEYFERATLRNRCYIAGPNGKLSLSVPLDGGRNQKTRMCDVKINNREKWQLLHWKTLQTCYNRSPYFMYFKDTMRPLFEKQYTYLFDLNMDTLFTINAFLSIKKNFSLTDHYQKDYGEQVTDMRKKFNAVHCKTEEDIHYLQPFDDKHGFIAGLSMLDLLFCQGKQATSLLSKD